VTHDDSSDENISRRRFLRMGAVAGTGAVFGAGLVGSRADAATAKVPKQTVSYQGAPKGASRCATCSFFEAPASCNYVDGPISPSGWCMLYQPKG
jgi:hypothetical protein